MAWVSREQIECHAVSLGDRKHRVSPRQSTRKRWQRLHPFTEDRTKLRVYLTLGTHGRYHDRRPPRSRAVNHPHSTPTRYATNITPSGCIASPPRLGFGFQLLYRPLQPIDDRLHIGRREHRAL